MSVIRKNHKREYPAYGEAGKMQKFGF